MVHCPGKTGVGTGKGSFLLLLGVVGTLIAVLALLVWWVPSFGLANIHPELPRWFGLGVLAVAAVLLGGLGLLALTLITGRDLFFSRRLRGLAFRYLLPAMIGIGRLLGADQEALQRAFIALNNQLVRARKLRVPADKAMILLPHCLQWFDCAIKVTGEIEKCARCGRCDLSQLADLARQRGITTAVATGGTLARKLLVEKRPRLVLAVACERDLAAGIRDAWPLPVIGVFNTRPEGPCFNTRIDLTLVEQALDEFILPVAPGNGGHNEVKKP